MIIGVKEGCFRVQWQRAVAQAQAQRQQPLWIDSNQYTPHTLALTPHHHATFTMAEANVPETPVTVVRPGKTMSEALLNEKVRLWAWWPQCWVSIASGGAAM